jgi:BirA family biotin operon repressor/biotin-[acetyl-CoA-carboxylase] ligase
VPSSDSLPADLADALATAGPRLGESARLRYFADVDSTNDVAMALAASGAPEGTAVLADAQRAGRGRRGRSWFSPPGAGLYLSMVGRPGRSVPSLSLMTLAAGVAVADAVTATTRLPIEIKWPNDLVMGRPWRKLGGVLCEAVATGSRVDAVVIGIGLNLRHVDYPAEIADRATSIEAEWGRVVDRATLVVELLGRVGDAVRRLRSSDTTWVSREWRRFGRAGLSGAPVRWQAQGALHRGLARDVDVDGALLVERDGRVERLVAGEVLWERLSRE